MKRHIFHGLGVASMIVAVAMLSGCQSGLGKASPRLVELYDMGRPDGVIEIEICRDGTIREMEGDVAVSALPALVKEAALKRAPGGRIIGAEREFMTDAMGWEVKIHHEGRDWEFVLDETGKLLEMEKELRAAEVAPVVLGAAEAAVPGSTFKSVELITLQDGTEEYHVKRLVQNVSYKVVLSPDGKVKRKVREHRAEIEIPIP